MLDYDAYTIGWICALQVELVAARGLLDDRHTETVDQPIGDNNRYTCGRIGQHNVVIAALPRGQHGPISAANVGTHMIRTFPNVRIGLMVGIGGGVPTKHDIRLGDVVVSSPIRGSGGVIQYDYGITMQGQGLVIKGTLNQPPISILEAINTLSAEHVSHGHNLEKTIQRAFERKPGLLKRFKRPNLDTDRLYKVDFIHASPGMSCATSCGESNIILRDARSADEDNPKIHYGLIASGNQLMKDAVVRDTLSAEEDILCFEMEAAGLSNYFPCVVIRGICDYSDSHKNIEWQGYAAIAAAAYAKDLLLRISPHNVEDEKRITQLTSTTEENAITLLPGADGEDDRVILDWLSQVDYISQQNYFIHKNHRGTGQWFVTSEKFQAWLRTKKKTLFCPGLPGAGKTLLTAVIIDHLHSKFKEDPNTGIAYIYCDWNRRNDQQAQDLLASLLMQLARGFSSLPFAVKLLYVPHRLGTTRPSIQEISQTLQTVIRLYSTTFIVIDALDGCETNDGCLETFLSEIRKLRHKTAANILLTSRPLKDLENQLGRCLVQEISAHDEDIISYLDPPEVEKGTRIQDRRLHQSGTTLAPASARSPRNTSNNPGQMSAQPTRHLGNEYHSTQVVDRAQLTDSGYASVASIEKKRQQALGGSITEHELAATDAELDDALTEYSDISGSAPRRHEDYIRELGRHLLTRVNRLKPDAKTQGRILEVLPDLLKAFALKIGHNASSQMHRDIMFFVHKNREDIVKSLQEKISEEQSERPPIIGTERIDSQSRINEWLQRQDSLDQEARPALPQAQSVSDSSDYSDSEKVEDQGTSESWILAYQKFIPDTPAYKWLVSRLQREIQLAVPAGQNALEAIRQEITHGLPPSKKISKRLSSKTYWVTFKLDWNPLTFLESQNYSVRPTEALDRVITLTGVSWNAQALTCSEYLNQTWPSTSEKVMALIKQLLDQPSHEHICDLSDGTILTTWMSEMEFVVEAHGVAASIVEIGEQLAWLGAALRASPLEQGLVSCTPFIGDIGESSIASEESSSSFSTKTVFKIEFTTEVQPHSGHMNGQCWHDMFLNPVIVKGYPIPRRAHPNTGVEIPLNMMAGLTGTRRVDRFDGKIFIKGFSSMLIPTRRGGDLLIWHLIYNKSGCRISYRESTTSHADHVLQPDLAQLRHIVGWCSEANFFAGSAQASHAVADSRLPAPHEACLLANASVSAGRLIVRGPPFIIGIKDRPLHVTREGEIGKLQWIDKKFVLLWDEEQKRGWLINGTSALLHLVRASLAHNSTDKFHSAFLFNDGDIKESPTPFTANSAIDVLICKRNKNLKVYPDKEGYILFEHRMEHFYNILEQLIDYQTELSGQHGVKWNSRPRRYLEGWDFKDLATKRDPCYPRIAELRTSGKGWVDFTRALHAITLVGRNFGEIIKPADAMICKHWATLPPQKYYIATCLSDLEPLMEQGGNWLNGIIIWHNPNTTSTTCRCEGESERDHCDPVQVLLPLAMSKVLALRKNPLPSRHGGAVIFGQNSAFNVFWTDAGDPEEKEQPPSSEVSDDEIFHDSGIGTSLMSPNSDPKIPLRADQCEFTQPSEEQQRRPPFSESITFMQEETSTRETYTVGVICALFKELCAVRVLFDCRHKEVRTAMEDSNHYVLGQIGQHNVVAACLPDGEYGTNSAADVASNMRRSFTKIEFCLLVGIGGGVPSKRNDIRLGDVVVSLPTRRLPGVVQYDLGKALKHGVFEPTGSLHRPPRFLMSAISSLRSDPDLGDKPLDDHLIKIANHMPAYQHPGQKLDELFTASCVECQGQGECDNTDAHRLERVRRPSDHPRIFYGLIASGNQVVKDAKVRDRLAEDDDVLCFEMEAAGVVNTLPCLVIRGICDYADSWKNEIWQEYAAASAAAYAKLLLSVVRSSSRVEHSLSLARRKNDEAPLQSNKRPRK